MMREITIGFDTSNYTTSCAVFDGETGENSSRLLDVPEGALGLRQSDALFAHVKRLPEVFSKLALNGTAIAVGASATPREIEGSYMPCFLAGASQGMILAKGLGIPYYAFSHQQGHVAAAAWSAGRMDILGSPLLCWHLSGGTTELLLVRPGAAAAPAGEGRLNSESKPLIPAGGDIRAACIACEILGGTNDVSTGQLLDRAGNLLGLKFPSGAALDALALEKVGGEEYFPKTDGMKFSLSGVEHKMKAMVSAGKQAGDIAYFALWAITSAIKAATLAARRQFGSLPVLFSGGVASSGFLRRALPDGIYAQPCYSADNAMGTAILTYRTVKNDK